MTPRMIGTLSPRCTAQARARKGRAVLIQLKGREALHRSPNMVALPGPGDGGDQVEGDGVDQVLNRHMPDEEARVVAAVVAVYAEAGQQHVGDNRQDNEGEQADPERPVSEKSSGAGHADRRTENGE